MRCLRYPVRLASSSSAPSGCQSPSRQTRFSNKFLRLFKMSWSSYCDNLIASGCVDHAAVCGLDDGGVWSQSPGFNVAPNEVKAVAAGFRNPDPIRANGIIVGGTKYFCLAAEDGAIQGKKGNAGVSIAKSGKCIIIGTYKEGQQPGNCRKQVEGIRDYLSNSGY